MAKIGIYEGFGARKKSEKKSKKTSHKARHHKKSSGKARTPQALRFKAAAKKCRRGGNATIKEMQACMRSALRK